MKKLDDTLSVGGPFRLDYVRKRENGVTSFDLKMAVSENGAPSLGAYATIETGEHGVGLFLTRAYGRYGIRFSLLEDCTIPPDSSIREAALLFCRAMLNASFSPMYDQRNEIAEEV